MPCAIFYVSLSQAMPYSTLHSNYRNQNKPNVSVVLPLIYHFKWVFSILCELKLKFNSEHKWKKIGILNKLIVCLIVFSSAAIINYSPNAFSKRTLTQNYTNCVIAYKVRFQRALYGTSIRVNAKKNLALIKKTRARHFFVSVEFKISGFNVNTAYIFDRFRCIGDFIHADLFQEITATELITNIKGAHSWASQYAR